MQTFLPYADFAMTAKSLDKQRLGKQRVETMQILNTFHRTSGGWINHPAVIMWRPYKNALIEYGITICNEWISKGYKDTCTDKILDHYDGGDVTMPPWLGDPDLHISHQSNLVQKNPDYYRPIFPDVPDNLPYVWPGEK